MKAVILYRPNSGHGSQVEQWVRDFTYRNPDRKAELISLDTKEGANKASVYGVTNYPAVLALNDSGELIQLWQGEQLPLMNEVAYYASQ